MRDPLVGLAGLDPDNTRILLGAEATREAIAVAVKGWLAERAQPEDDVFIYYAGHGIQLPDNNGDEDDGLDECVLAQDTLFLDITLIRDDDLSRWLSAVRANNKIVVLDCCHSGTGSRAMEGVTIRSAEIAPDEFRLSSEQAYLRTERSIDDAIQRSSIPIMRTTPESFETPLPENTSFELAGCLPHQVVVEATVLKHGALTYFIAQGLAGPADANRDGSVTLQEIREYAQAELRKQNYEQDPQLYGQGADGYVLSRVAATPPPAETLEERASAPKRAPTK